MSPKQNVYQEMLRVGLIHLRNVACQRWWRRLRDTSAAFESELIHHLWHLSFESAFDDGDLWFLNHHARWYYENCSPKLSRWYANRLGLFRELFALVPETYRPQLQWSGPP